MKQEIHELCVKKLEANIQQLTKAIADIQTAANQETKSSAGDKYETGRAMMQQEKDKLNARLATNQHQLSQLNQLKPELSKAQAENGSLVRTNEGLFYFAAAIGKLLVGTQKCFVISLDSPLAKALWHKRKDEIIIFQGRKIRIVDIL
ncbi:MAG: GreA/GreB family elongation factor [Saprospiraceae bacterium]|nr:GreA/GreB family elongation factor [Saprospiraceae bacterium]